MPNKTKSPRGPRHRPMMTVTLSPEAIEMLDSLAAGNGQSKSATIEALVRRAAKARTA